MLLLGPQRVPRTTSLVTHHYKPEVITYNTYGSASDVLRVSVKPQAIICDGIRLKEIAEGNTDGYNWRPLSTGGVLRITHTGKNLEIRL
jgi:hypothetical protein